MSEESPERRFPHFVYPDVHLGARGSQAERLLDFLRVHDADTIYLVRRYRRWLGAEIQLALAAIAQRLRAEACLRKARKGAKVIYVPGNHDEFLR